MMIRPIAAVLRRHKISVSLIVVEIALTCFIAINASYVMSLMLKRVGMPSGVVENQLVVIKTADSLSDGQGAKARTQAQLAMLRDLAGVRAVAAVNQMPFGGSNNQYGIRLSPEQNHSTLAASAYYGYGLVNTFGLHLVAGRDFKSDEYVDSTAIASGKEHVSTAIITRALAHKLWPHGAALGKTFYIGHPVRVVGVVASLIQPSNPAGPATQWTMLLPVRMTAAATFVLRTRPEQRPGVLKAAVAALTKLDPRTIVIEKDSLSHIRAHAYRSVRSTLHVMLVVVAALLLVTGLGIVGLASFWVAQRHRSIGVRRALGATRRDVLRYFQIENFLIVGIGIVIGMVLAYGLGLVLMLSFHVPLVPFWYLPVGACLLWALGQLAVLGPALRASRVPPVVATRSV